MAERTPMHNGNTHHIALGRTLDGTRIILLIDHLDVRIIHAGESR